MWNFGITPTCIISLFLGLCALFGCNKSDTVSNENVDIIGEWELQGYEDGYSDSYNGIYLPQKIYFRPDEFNQTWYRTGDYILYGHGEDPFSYYSSPGLETDPFCLNSDKDRGYWSWNSRSIFYFREGYLIPQHRAGRLLNYAYARTESYKPTAQKKLAVSNTHLGRWETPNVQDITHHYSVAGAVYYRYYEFYSDGTAISGRYNNMESIKDAYNKGVWFRKGDLIICSMYCYNTLKIEYTKIIQDPGDFYSSYQGQGTTYDNWYQTMRQYHYVSNPPSSSGR